MSDSTPIVMAHHHLVATILHGYFISQLYTRAEQHDLDKITDPIQKETFDKWTPELRKRAFGSDEYKQALDAMGEGVQRHYLHNRHHPEHFSEGINQMTLVDIVEMVADWIAAARRNNNAPVDLEFAAQRFGIESQLLRVIQNTINEIKI